VVLVRAFFYASAEKRDLNEDKGSFRKDQDPGDRVVEDQKPRLYLPRVDHRDPRAEDMAKSEDLVAWEILSK
jgi:hypothetical protein